VAVTYEEVGFVDQATMRIKVRSDRTAPVPFSLWVEGAKVESVVSPDGVWIFFFPNGVAFEVTDIANERPMIMFPSITTLNWLHIKGVTKYRVDQYINSAWVSLGTVDSGRTAYSWKTDRLQDGVVYQFRVVALFSTAQEGPIKTFSFDCRRHPDINTTVATIDSNRRLTVA
jgi:hypothetical protein